MSKSQFWFYASLGNWESNPGLLLQ